MTHPSAAALTTAWPGTATRGNPVARMWSAVVRSLRLRLGERRSSPELDSKTPFMLRDMGLMPGWNDAGRGCRDATLWHQARGPRQRQW